MISTVGSRGQRDCCFVCFGSLGGGQAVDTNYEGVLAPSHRLPIPYRLIYIVQQAD